MSNKSQILQAWEHVASDFQQATRASCKGGSLSYIYRLQTGAKGNLVFSQGRVESWRKYTVVLTYFYDCGYNVFMQDHLGQGDSARLTSAREKGHIDDFATFVEDLNQFTAQVVEPLAPGLETILCGHSMGAAIGTLACLQQPHYYAKLVCLSPMYAIQAPLPQGLAKRVINWGCLLGAQSQYFFGQGPYAVEDFADNRITRDAAQYSAFLQMREQYPQTKLGGVTFGWLHAALRAMSQIEQQIDTLEMPVLVMLAGADKIVDNRQALAYQARIDNIQLVKVPDAKHELLFELPAVRDFTLQTVRDFIC